MFKVEGSELLERLFLLRTRIGAVRPNHPSSNSHPPSSPNANALPSSNTAARGRPRPSQTLKKVDAWSKINELLEERMKHPGQEDGRPRSDSVASAVLETYEKLGTKGKPKRRENGDREWTVLAGFCLCYKPDEMTEDWEVQCVALGTGLKVLPHSKLPVHGDVLHDSHAEIVAKRGLVLWLYHQLEEAVHGRKSCLEHSDQRGWSLREGIMFALYISTLPCGDASTYSLSLSSAPLPPTPSPPLCTTTHHSTLIANSLGLHTSRTTSFDAQEVSPPLILRGRTNYSALSSLRTKPGRADSPPSTSHSCSDKIACWNVVGLGSALLGSLLAGEVQLGMLVLGGVHRDEWEKIGEEVTRAVGGRVGKEEAVRVGFTELKFVDGERGTGAVSCPESISWALDLGLEVVNDGIKQGNSAKRAAGQALEKHKRSRLCKLSLFETHAHTQQLLGATGSSLSRTYFEAKHSSPSTCYQERKAQLRTKGGPLEGWIVSGKAFESFDVAGVIQER